jgi:hypothetical protein
MKPLSLASGDRLSPKNLYYWELLYLPLKGQFSTPVGDLVCLGQKFDNDATQET